MALDLSVLGNAKVYTLWHLYGTCISIMINLLQNEEMGQSPLSARPLRGKKATPRPDDVSSRTSWYIYICIYVYYDMCHADMWQQEDDTVDDLDSLPGTPPSAVQQAYLHHVEAAGVPDPEGHFPRAA